MEGGREEEEYKQWREGEEEYKQWREGEGGGGI